MTIAEPIKPAWATNAGRTFREGGAAGTARAAGEGIDTARL